MGKNCAISIGINRYKNLQNLNFAKRDAEAMRDLFLTELEMNSEDVYHFTEDSPPIPANPPQTIDSQPTYTGLRQFLRIRFEEPFLKAQDNLWFFFAGHGVEHEGHDYLMPLDGDPGDVENSAIPISFVTQRLRRSGAENIILLIDACRSLTRKGLGVGEELQQGVVTFYACSPRQQSYEIDHPDIQHGSFTYALLQGLKLQSRGKNCATVERLDQHLEIEVPKLNQQYDKPVQQPYCKIEPRHKEKLILLPRKADLDDVLALKIQAYRAERNTPLEAKQLWYRVLAVNGSDTEAIDAIEALARRVTPIDRPISTPNPSETQTSPPSRQISVEPEPSIVQTPPQDWQSRKNSVDLGNGIAIEMVRIPAGKFLMGSPDTELERADCEGPQHEVAVAEFWMGQYPITQAQWQLVASLPKEKIPLKPKPSLFDGKDFPVETVSWHEAVEFCSRLSKQTSKAYRLPTEAQWEYACRAGTETPFYFGDTVTPEQANYDENYTYGDGPQGQYRQTTTLVGTFPANDFGLYDMHGNIWEWCLDHWHENYKGAPSDGSAWLAKNDNHSRLLRGGSWSSYPRGCRSAYRFRCEPGSQSSCIGFRVVCVSARAF